MAEVRMTVEAVDAYVKQLRGIAAVVEIRHGDRGLARQVDAIGDALHQLATHARYGQPEDGEPR